MKVGLVYPQVELRGDPQAVHDIGVGAEQLGFDSLLVYDHVVGAEHDHRQPPLRGPYTRIARRVCAFEWRRTDPVGDGSTFADTYTRGLRGSDDIVWHILDETEAVTSDG